MTLQASPPISLSDVYAEYSAPNGTALGAFVRGGAWVPDTAQNAGVPTSKPISLGDLLDSSVVAGITYDMVAGLTQTQNTGFDNGDGTVNQIGSILPTTFGGRAIHRVRRDNSGLTVTLFQQNSGDVPVDFWTSILFTGPGAWNNVTVLASSANFLDNNGSAAWINIPDPGAFINGLSY